MSATPAHQSDPAMNIALVTPSDTVNLVDGTGSTFIARGISFGTAGDLKVTARNGQTVIIPSGALAAGIIHPVSLTRIWATGTTAANIVAYY